MARQTPVWGIESAQEISDGCLEVLLGLYDPRLFPTIGQQHRLYPQGPVWAEERVPVLQGELRQTFVIVFVKWVLVYVSVEVLVGLGEVGVGTDPVGVEPFRSHSRLKIPVSPTSVRCDPPRLTSTSHPRRLGPSPLPQSSLLQTERQYSIF